MMNFFTSLHFLPFLLALSATAVAGPKSETVPLPSPENRQVADGAMSELDANVSHEVKLGDPIRVNLLYPSVDFDGDIEYVITSGLGDRETLTVQPLEADKTRFRGQLPTRIGKPQADDKVLQTRVGDEITIELSPGAIAKIKNMNALAVKCRVVAGD